MSAGRPVARLVTPVVVGAGAMTVIMAAIAVTGVVLSTRAVDHLTRDLQPAATANQEVYLDLTTMSAAVAAWTSSGQRTAPDDYQQALTRLSGDEQVVLRFAAGDRALEAAVEQQARAAHAWLTAYAEPLIGSPGGRAVTARQLRAGSQRFEAFRAAHQAADQAFALRMRRAHEDASARLQGTVLAVVVAAAIAWYVLSRARRRLMNEITEPLRALELVVQRMARQDHDVRAEPAGPREIRAVAAALNELADAQRRASAVEGRIQTELRTLDTARDDFVSNVSHELRTPLTTISGYLELVAEEFEGRMQSRHERMLDATRRNVTRLRTLIDDILTLSRAEGREADTEEVDLNLLLREVATDVRITAARRGVQVEVDAPGGPVAVTGDRAMLHRAVLNLLTNAVKFSHDGGTVEVRLERRGADVEVRIVDHGIGIPAAEIDRLGTRFFRASNAVTNEIAGTGLGVRITQTIVDKHAGSMVIESGERAGTMVRVRLPAREAAGPQADRGITPITAALGRVTQSCAGPGSRAFAQSEGRPGAL